MWGKLKREGNVLGGKDELFQFDKLFMCDRRIKTIAEGKFYQTVMRPALVFGSETALLSKRQEAELEVEETKMVNLSL